MVTSIPKLNKKFLCIVSQDSPVLAGVVSSYLYSKGEYNLMFEFPEVTSEWNEANSHEVNEHYITTIKANTTKIQISNTLNEIGGCEYLILAGLTSNQKSYLDFLDNYNVIEVETEKEIDTFLREIVQKKDYLACREQDIYEGLFVAAKSNKLLQIDNTAGKIELKLEGSEGLIVLERDKYSTSIIPVNYALAFNLDIAVIDLPQIGFTEIKSLIERWKEEKDDKFYTELSAKLYALVEAISFKEYKFATFFTFGAPYSLVLNNIIPFTHVNTHLKPDFFVYNNLKVLNDSSSFSALVFSPLEFGVNEETSFVIEELKKNNFFVKSLLGKKATVFNIDNSISEYPFDLLHICSHGGEVNGYYVVEEYHDRDGHKHIVEYDEVLSLAQDESEELIPVFSKKFWKKFDGLDWMSNELKGMKFPHYVFSDMINEIDGKKVISRIKKGDIPNSHAIKCINSNYQGHFNILAGSRHYPLVFNNTCWSWSDISHSFLYCGARGYIGTLWAIQNDVATLSAETFYKNIFSKTVLEALQDTIVHTRGNKNENIYIFWGLHFTKFKPGNSVSESKENVARRLTAATYKWSENLKLANNQSTKDNINRRIKWIKNQLIDDFFFEWFKFMTGIIRKRAEDDISTRRD